MQYVMKEIDFLKGQLNKNPCCSRIGHQTLLDYFFDKETGFQHTVVLVGNFTMMILYGYNSAT